MTISRFAHTVTLGRRPGGRMRWCTSRAGWLLLAVSSALTACTDPTVVTPTAPRNALVSATPQAASPAYFIVTADAAGILQSNGTYLLGSDSLRLETGKQPSGTASAVLGANVGAYRISGSAGSQSANLDLSTSNALLHTGLAGGTGSVRYTVSSGAIAVYVLGPPGTPYMIQRAESCDANAFVDPSSDLGGAVGASAGASASTSCSAGGRPGLPAQRDSKSNTFSDSGATALPSLSYGNAIYSYARTYSVGSRVDLSTTGHENDVTAQWDARGALTVTAQGQQPSQPPVARISGPSTVNVNVPATFDGSGSSDPDGSITAYSWSITTPNGTVTDSGSAITYTWAAPGTYQVSLTVTDDDGLTNTTAKSIIVTQGQQPPVVIIEGPTMVEVGDVVTFDGSRSYDPDGSIVGFSWKYRPPSGNLVMPTASAAGAGSVPPGAMKFTVPFTVEGTHFIKATATDDDGLIGIAVIAVIASRSAGCRVILQAQRGSYYKSVLIPPQPLTITKAQGIASLGLLKKQIEPPAQYRFARGFVDALRFIGNGPAPQRKYSFPTEQKEWEGRIDVNIYGCRAFTTEPERP